MAAQSPTEQTISTRCRRLRQLIDMYFRALEWVIHHDNGWQLGKAENRFCLNRQNLKVLGINTVADINDDPDWTQSIENVMWDKKSVDETGLFYRSDLQSKAEPGGLERLPDNAVITMITFNPNPEHIPIWEIKETVRCAFHSIEKDIQTIGVSWPEPPTFQYCECAQNLLDYVKAKSQKPEEILKNLETERKRYKQLANTVRRRSTQLSNKTLKQAGTGQGNKSGKKTKTKKRRKRKIKLTDKQKEIWESIKGGATVSELAAEQGCSDTNIRQQYAKAKAKLKKLNTGSKSVNFRTIGQIPKDRRGQETLEDKRKTT